VNAERFDTLFQSLSETPSRRSAVRLLAGSLLGGLLLLDRVPIQAKKSGKGRGKGKRKGKDKQKVTICHNGQTITVSKSALKAHKKHGDTTGACPTQDSSPVAGVTCPGPGNSALSGSRRFAQTFVALNSGLLTSAKIELDGSQDGADFVVEIRAVDESGAPTTTVLATTTVDNVPSTPLGAPSRTITAVFATPATVIAGQTFALSLTAGVFQAFAVDAHDNDPCGDGRLFSDAFADGTFRTVGNFDMAYATFVRS
jgi:hypothetical protein